MLTEAQRHPEEYQHVNSTLIEKKNLKEIGAKKWYNGSIAVVMKIKLNRDKFARATFKMAAAERMFLVMRTTI